MRLVYRESMHRVLVAFVVVGAGCGDNLRQDLVVETRVASSTLVAGDPVGAHCSIVDAHGEPVLDGDGNALSDHTDFTIGLEAPESFATDGNGHPIAAKAGTATVRCGAPALGLLDATPENVTIVAGAPVRVITKLERPTTLAGQADGVTCLAFDAFDNPVADAAQAIAISPSGAGTMTTSASVTASLAGTYVVTCVVMGAADVQPADLVVLPALPAQLVGALAPERTLYAILDEVTLIATAFDQFGNRVDDVALAYAATPTVASPSPARFQFSQDGAFMLSANVTSPTQDNLPLGVSLPALVDSNGPAIQCMRIDAPNVTADAYMVQQAPASVVVQVRIGGAFAAQSVTIGGAAASFNANTGNYEAAVAVGFGMSFIDVVATDQNGVENSRTCFVLAGAFYSPEAATMPGSVALRLDQNAIGDPNPNGLNSLNDLFFTVIKSDALRALVDQALVGANPINNGGCGVFACEPTVTYNGGSIAWDTPVTSLSLIAGGLRANVHLPNVRLTVRACGTTCCIGGSNIVVTASFIDATVDFHLTLQGGLVRTSLSGTPQVTVGNVNLNGSGFCGFVVNLIQGFFTGTVKNAVQSSLQKFLSTNVAPLLDQVTSSLDISTLAQSFAVPRLDGSGSIGLNFGLDFSSLDISTMRALIGVGTKFTPAMTAQSRPSLGIARRTPDPLLDPPGTTAAKPVGISAYEGLLNQVLHALWRGGYLQASLSIGNGTAVIDSWLPPVAEIDPSNTAHLMLGGVSATLTIPGIIDQPIQIMFGGRANAAVSLVGDTLVFGNLTLDQLYVSFDVRLSQPQRDAMESFLGTALQDVLASAINNGLPAFPIPSFTLPPSVAMYGLPAGAEMGIVNPVLTTASAHCVLDGQFGAR
jgi:hypothetical protein